MDGFTKYLLDREKMKLLAIKKALLEEKASEGDEYAQLQLVLRKLKWKIK